jgi:hypothetical protein
VRRSSSLRAKPSELEEWAAEIPRFATIRRGAQGLKMPAFREALSDCEIWQIVLFTKHMNSLPPGNSPGLGVTKSLAVAGEVPPSHLHDFARSLRRLFRGRTMSRIQTRNAACSSGLAAA